MKMTDRPPSVPALEEPVSFGCRNGKSSNNAHRRGSDKSNEASGQLFSASTDADTRPTVTRPPTAKLPLPTDVAEGQASLRHPFSHVYHSSSTSRSPSTRTSSSSLQALNEDAVVDARSDGIFGRPSLPRRTSHLSQSDTQPAEYPVYPDQSYAVLQSQVHPTYQPPHLRSRSSYPSRTEILTRFPPARVSRTAGNTPISSPGLFSVRSPRSTPPFGSDDEGRMSSPYLHPTHLQPPKETHTAEVDRDIVTGNKLINQYEILKELGRGEHGKVKLGRHVATRQKVAIKIVQRYSKRRRLGKLGNPEDKVKKEVAILKKARHPNVVSLLEVIDDPNRQKVYIVLEYVENGEIIWRRRGLREIVHVDKNRLEREKAGIPDSPSFMEESLHYIRTAQHLRHQREKARERRQAQAAYAQQGPIPAWSLEHGAESDEEEEGAELAIARTSSRSMMSQEEAQSSPPHSFMSAHESALAAVEGSMYGAYADYTSDRRFSTASSSFGYAPSEPEWFSDDDDTSYVPCLTFTEARNAFRDSLLGLEYLHYQGIIHRDIKPANLLVTSNHRVKISDFGVSYLGRPIRDEEEEQVGETDATELDDARELSKTVGTPAFYAPELCYTGEDFVDTIGNVPQITGAIDVWSLGVTLYGMIFGRLPFVSDDEYSMFQTIVKKEVFIPRKRLKPVEDDPDTVSQWPRYADNSKRMEHELVYEEIDDELYDLLKRLLTKDPIKRITVKEIKHHPWILNGLPNPRAWVEETDPRYQSKIEVSNEEVTTAVSKVPFIQRVRSNVAKWSNYLTGRSKEKEKDNRKRTPSAAPSMESSASSGTSIGKYLWDNRRGSFKDEDFLRPSRLTRDGEHPLSQSVSASPVGRDEQSCYFQDVQFETTLSNGRTPRPDPPARATSTLSTAESAKTVKPSNIAPGFPGSQQTGAPARVETTGTTNVSGLFGGASRRLARGLQSGERRPDRPVSEVVSLDGDRHSEPSLALSVASAVGHHSNLLLDEESSSARVEVLGHRRNRSHQLPGKASGEPLYLTKEALLRQRRNEVDPAPSKGQSIPHSNSEPCAITEQEPRDVAYTVENASPDQSTVGLTTSPPSAATISSSSVDDYTSGISQSTSHPSIPSVVSGASSLSGEGFPREKECESAIEVPSILRTGETVKARRLSPPRPIEEDESRYYCDDEDDFDDDSEDEGLTIGKKKATPQKPILRRNHTSQ
ncbi:putative serine/threonine protein kinase [Aspergillus steynii IBT 23096]|uniref:non-specific serine/threonine protein kinase n=1 Tax=Aspergillus steynii IBT 23096 TaxID=1392250 RepID=A0A2I2G240_9EURO|nr:putative serine/threonine protein kinase [Aspergillus steynii IBT 23096]PLB46929.1 putative serine/threonine protein kinase [Aspergillus steynii IBT 23096]